MKKVFYYKHVSFIFLSKFWFRWSWPGMGVIVLGTWYQVQVDVKINEWFGDFTI